MAVARSYTALLRIMEVSCRLAISSQVLALSMPNTLALLLSLNW